jgi:hypothetical protein
MDNAVVRCIVHCALPPRCPVLVLPQAKHKTFEGRPICSNVPLHKTFRTLAKNTCY